MKVLRTILHGRRAWHEGGRRREATPELTAFFRRLRNGNINGVLVALAAAIVLPESTLLTTTVVCGVMTALWAATAVMTARGHWERLGELATGLSVLWATVAAAVAAAENAPEHRGAILLAYTFALIASPLFAYWINGRIESTRGRSGD